MIPELEFIPYQFEMSSFRSYRFKKDRLDFNWHYHPEFEITCIVSGSGTRMVGQDSSGYTENDLVLLGPNLPHTWYNTPGNDKNIPHEVIVLHFSLDKLDKLLSLPEFLSIKNMLHEASQGLAYNKIKAQKLYPLLAAIPELEGAGRVSAFLNLLEQMALMDGKPISRNSAYRASGNKSIATRLQTVHDYISKNYKNDITLQEAAMLARMSPVAFSRFFKQTMGITFIRYVIEVRINYVCSQLIQTDEDISGIAFGAGFKNLSNFNRQFKLLKKESPSDFRAKHLI